MKIYSIWIVVCILNPSGISSDSSIRGRSKRETYYDFEKLFAEAITSASTSQDTTEDLPLKSWGHLSKCSEGRKYIQSIACQNFTLPR